jgi:uncharacterized protein
LHYFELGKKAYYDKNMKKAKQYFKIASEYGDIKSNYNLATIYSNNKQYKKAYPFFLKAARKNHPASQNKVGLFLLYGWGIKKDYNKALHWFERAYFKNHYLPAVCNLSYMFANGYGAMFNFGRAAKLARIGMKADLPRCKRVYNDYNLEKYSKDKGFKYGNYAD